MIIPKDLDQAIGLALRHFWQTRDSQLKQQRSPNAQGNRGAVTGGKQMDCIIELIQSILTANGVPPDTIFTDSDLELPGYYRPNKKWDLLVVDRGELVMAIECKSQVGPSFGNNFNDRTEEAMGSALDIWTAYREGGFGSQKPPWLGYFLVLEDCDRSSAPVKVRSPHFPVRKEFVDASYKKRYEIFCSKLLLERQYSAACFLTTGRDPAGRIWQACPAHELSYHAFIASMLGAVLAHLNEGGRP